MAYSNLPIRPNVLVRLEERHPFLTRWLVRFVYTGLIGGIGILAFLYYLSFSLPDLTELEKPQYDLPTQVYDRNGRLVTEFYTKRRVLIPYNDVPEVMTQALLAIEDSRFYSHYGIDLIRIAKAIVIDVIKMDFAQGASTLTQQTAKMFLLSSEKKIIRKLRELLLAVQIESRFTKNQILELYLNKAYFGHGAYGLEAAAQGYFSKSASELELEEAALLAGLPQAPSRWAPTASIKNATRRRNLVLGAMAYQGYITEEEAKAAQAKPIVLKLGKSEDSNEASYYTEHIRRMVLDLYGMDMLYTGGLKVHAFMDLKMQIAAQQSLTKGLYEHDRRQGYRGARANLWRQIGEEQTFDQPLFDEQEGRVQWVWRSLEDDTKTQLNEAFEAKVKKNTAANHFLLGGEAVGVVREVGRNLAQVDLGPHQGTIHLEDHRWARPVDYEKALNWRTRLRDLRDVLKAGDVIDVKLEDHMGDEEGFALLLHQAPEANGAIFAVDPRTNEVLAMSGGFDFAQSEYNRAIQAERQPGSAFKPIVYSMALDKSFTRSSMLDDTPLVFKDTQWRPGNFSKSFKGKISLKNALAHSKNVPTIRLTMSLGIEKIIEHARSLGISAELPEDLTIGLGTASVTLKELARTYSIFANGGKLIEPRFVRRIETPEGKVLLDQSEYREKSVMAPETAFLTTMTLQDVVRRGSGFRAQALGRPAAGKTGTTNNYTDAWFMGFVPQLLAGVYVGFDDIQRSLGQLETGSRAAAPVWVDFMMASLKTMPVLPFGQPEGIQMVKIVPSSGLLDCDEHPKAEFEYFKNGTQPIHCHQEADTGLADYYAAPEEMGADSEAPADEGPPEEEDPDASAELESAPPPIATPPGNPFGPPPPGDGFEEL